MVIINVNITIVTLLTAKNNYNTTSTTIINGY